MGSSVEWGEECGLQWSGERSEVFSGVGRGVWSSVEWGRVEVFSGVREG